MWLKHCFLQQTFLTNRIKKEQKMFEITLIFLMFLMQYYIRNNSTTTLLFYNTNKMKWIIVISIKKSDWWKKTIYFLRSCYLKVKETLTLIEKEKWCKHLGCFGNQKNLRLTLHRVFHKKTGPKLYGFIFK